jgi:hypothetical protein
VGVRAVLDAVVKRKIPNLCRELRKEEIQIYIYLFSFIQYPLLLKMYEVALRYPLLYLHATFCSCGIARSEEEDELQGLVLCLRTALSSLLDSGYFPKCQVHPDSEMFLRRRMLRYLAITLFLFDSVFM